MPKVRTALSRGRCPLALPWARSPRHRRHFCARVLKVDDEELEVALVYPEDADDRAGKLSVSSGIGTAILGYKEGDAFSWRMPNRTCHIRIDKVLYQPEAAGDFHL